MKIVVGFAHFWYDFIIGDDPTVAIVVVIALVLTALLARTHVPAWWLLPAAVILLLGSSLWRATRAR